MLIILYLESPGYLVGTDHVVLNDSYKFCARNHISTLLTYFIFEFWTTAYTFVWLVLPISNQDIPEQDMSGSLSFQTSAIS